MGYDAHETLLVQYLYTHIQISESINTVLEILHSFSLKITVAFQFLINLYNVKFCSTIWGCFPLFPQISVSACYLFSKLQPVRKGKMWYHQGLHLIPAFHISGDGSRLQVFASSCFSLAILIDRNSMGVMSFCIFPSMKAPHSCPGRWILHLPFPWCWRRGWALHHTMEWFHGNLLFFITCGVLTEM